MPRLLGTLTHAMLSQDRPIDPGKPIRRRQKRKYHRYYFPRGRRFQIELRAGTPDGLLTSKMLVEGTTVEELVTKVLNACYDNYSKYGLTLTDDFELHFQCVSKTLSVMRHGLTEYETGVKKDIAIAMEGSGDSVENDPLMKDMLS